MTRPLPTDHSDFYARYVNMVPETDLLAAMRAQAPLTRAAVLAFADRPDQAYAPGKWTVRQVLGHMTDTERVFGYRALAFARGDTSPLPGFAQDDWMDSAEFGRYTLEDLLTEFEAVRVGHLSWLSHLPEAAWERRGTASGQGVTVRSLAYMLLGHERAHVEGLNERYSGRKGQRG
ncbi:DinB family protein [Deinococcus sp. QL22]|uniref:DinB family protein n=1 Tax=Deinococcus sp. QL22 TaxID=2939437 RepID=UPI0020183722|nr:DinB family protein [Deinococcus sp. QL22]UQN09335.1 DinB family protein [Deinococcus sp. QL22]